MGVEVSETEGQRLETGEPSMSSRGEMENQLPKRGIRGG